MSWLLFAGQAWTDRHQALVLAAAALVVVLGLMVCPVPP